LAGADGYATTQILTRVPGVHVYCPAGTVHLLTWVATYVTVKGAIVGVDEADVVDNAQAKSRVV
jgi:hypothetical protein